MQTCFAPDRPGLYPGDLSPSEVALRESQAALALELADQQHLQEISIQPDIGSMHAFDPESYALRLLAFAGK